MFEPKSELTNTWVAELALEEGISGYWIGITDKKFEGKFVYQSDSKSIGFHWWDIQFMVYNSLLVLDL